MEANFPSRFGFNASSSQAPDRFVDKYGLTVLFNGSFAGAIPATISWFHSAILQRVRALTGLPAALAPGDMAFGMTFDPFPRDVTRDFTTQQQVALGTFLSSMISGFYVAMGFIVVPSVQLIAVVKERETEIKQLQLVQGVTPLAYWLGLWAWDATQFVPPAIGTIVVAVSSGVYDWSDIPGLTVLLAAFGASLPGQGYAFSFLFSKATSAQTWSTLTLLLLSLIFFGIAFVVRTPAGEDGSTAGGDATPYIQMFTCLLPTNALALGLSDIRLRDSCELLAGNSIGESCERQSSLAWAVVGDKVAVLLLQVPIMFFLLLQIEHSTQATGSDGSGSDPLAGLADIRPQVVEDADVHEERAKIDRDQSAAAGGSTV